MYEFPSAKNSAIMNQNAPSSNANGIPGAAISRAAMELNQRAHSMTFSQTPREAENAWAPKSPKSTFKSGVREPTLKVKVEEYIEMPASSIGIPEERKYAFYRDI